MTMNLPMVNNVESIVRNRDTAMALFTEAADLLSAASTKIKEANQFANLSHFGTSSRVYDEKTARDSEVKIPNPEFFTEANRKIMDSRIWTYLLEKSGIDTIMDAQAKKEFQNSISEFYPEVTLESVQATFAVQRETAGMMFNRGIMNTFSKLDRRFKSHDGFKLGSRVILDRFCDEYGSVQYGGTRDTMIDMERVFAVLANEAPDNGAFIDQIKRERSAIGIGWGNGAQSEHETRYFKIRIFKNGNAHMWFTQDALTEKVNQRLAELYGDVLPDAAAKDEPAKRDRTGTAVSKDLQFYATPVDAAKEILNKARVYFKEGMKILEPSAGEGALVAAMVPLLKTGSLIDVVEYDRDRLGILFDDYKRHLGTVAHQNFFDFKKDGYDFIFMNPPFYGTHYMDHVYHAFDKLAAGGTLIAILPVTAEVGDSKRHRDFQRFVEKNSDKWGHKYHDLPAGTFKESGTNINTIWIELTKK